jgi:4a-hydroxytetrahydrobiopterin dehydratase
MTSRREVLGDDEIERALGSLPWERDGDALTRTFKLKDFREALSFVNAVGELAEARNHHPDIDIRWNKVTLRLSTHSAGGVTEMDVELARSIDSLAPERTQPETR